MLGEHPTARAPLITDDAWGLDYSFCSRLPPSAMESGEPLPASS